MLTLSQETRAVQAPPKAAARGRTTGRLRDFLLLLYVTGTAGTVVELILLGHFDDLCQGAPLLALPAGLVALCWHRIRRTHRATRAFQFAMVLLISSGFVGLWFHASRNLGFAAEMDPLAAGWTVLRESLTGPTPALAPATTVHFGLLGLLYTYRHPWLRSGATAARPRNLPSQGAPPSR